MTKRLFVGNLAFSTTEDELKEAFAPYGVSDIHLPSDSMSGRPRGFAFVTVEEAQAGAAISEWDGKELNGRPLTVNEAKPREERGGGGGRGGSRGGYGGGGGRGGW
ncbi:MAG TPA: RNA-binding protein [Armatimonadota bacterium]|jgi:RNA recognition motif-containing protein|nr:RNA-binding protein [Armatimonadota bacterium]